jgi:DNA replication protein DnaC
MTIGEQLKAKLAEMQARAETPEFQAAVARLERETADQKAVRERQERLLYLTTHGIPRAAWEWLDTPEQTDAITAAKAMLANERQMFLTLAGPLGRGKTSALAWLAYQRRGHFTTAVQLQQASTFDATLWDELARTPLLSVDEFGAEYPNEAFLSNLFGLLNRRCDNLQPTAIGTNLDARAFEARYANGPMARLADRLRAYGQWVTLPGQSMRKPLPSHHHPDEEREP